MDLRTWMASLPRGDLSRIAREHNLRLADFYDARDGSARGVKTAARAQKIAAATGGAVSAASILGLVEPEPTTSSKPTMRDGVEALVADADKAAEKGHAA